MRLSRRVDEPIQALYKNFMASNKIDYRIGEGIDSIDGNKI